MPDQTFEQALKKMAEKWPEKFKLYGTPHRNRRKGMPMRAVLIFAIAFTSCAASQTHSPVNSRDDSITVCLSNSVLVSDFFDYSQECYNDSTDCGHNGWRVPADEEIARDSTLAFGDVVIRVHIADWIHRQPTFDGFLHYLKDKDALRQMRMLKEQVKRKR